MEPAIPPYESEPSLRVLSSQGPLDWDVIYRRNVASIYSLLYSRVGNKADAEDLTSQVFLAALPHIRPSSSPGEAHAYLVATARTVLADHWRRRLGVQVTAISDNFAGETHDDPDRGGDRARQVQDLLDLLPPNYRQILTLRFLELHSVRTAAAIMSVSVANAKVLQHRALRRAAELSKERE
ncbi:MAG: sigma-70 family RNA polymerase sigma factor [Candidatus Dormibacteraeota bacterium]|nr:sigma-70 family RNA polymerase sigma factor [Candidatus Dormibacteraeota bacterium]